jgi:hypothetical protein
MGNMVKRIAEMDHRMNITTASASGRMDTDLMAWRTSSGLYVSLPMSSIAGFTKWYFTGTPSMRPTVPAIAAQMITTERLFLIPSEHPTNKKTTMGIRMMAVIFS